MIILKTSSEATHKETPGTHDLEMINQYALEPVTEADVFVGRVKLCNDQYDKAHERFTKAILDRFAETLPGKPVLRGHNQHQEPAGKFFDAEVIKDGAGTHHVLARYYLAGSDPLAAKVRTGIAKEVSIGAVGAQRYCDLCEKDLDTPDCIHIPGRDYAGKTATATYGGDVSSYEAKEGSFVVWGCQPGAETVRSADTAEGLTLLKMAALDAATDSTSDARINANGTGKEPRMETQAPAPAPDVTKDQPDELTVLKGWKQENERLIEDGKAYRARLKAEITRLAGITKTDEFAALILKTADSAAIGDLEAIEKSLLAKMNEMFPPSGHGIPAAPQHDQTPAAPEPFSPFRNRFVRRAS